MIIAALIIFILMSAGIILAEKTKVGHKLTKLGLKNFCDIDLDKVEE
jgi:hypothetical protein